MPFAWVHPASTVPPRNGPENESARQRARCEESPIPRTWARGESTTAEPKTTTQTKDALPKVVSSKRE